MEIVYSRVMPDHGILLVRSGCDGGKLSQILVIDDDAARSLYRNLREEFGDDEDGGERDGATPVDPLALKGGDHVEFDSVLPDGRAVHLHGVVGFSDGRVVAFVDPFSEWTIVDADGTPVGSVMNLRVSDGGDGKGFDPVHVTEWADRPPDSTSDTTHVFGKPSWVVDGSSWSKNQDSKTRPWRVRSERN